ncbi:MAG: alpha/beta fold hydrolase [Rhodospirillaceae bacterium]|jgi:pimeloyl-ACP methyl ester carboxylesterase|nr:alpha/beta fold hydrolase [Rhodospirillaceae bacterium]MBT3492003.1 alpha/beta fold hydrolase [Rhodospirillaceae bacterium]MBT3779205.1 alpha/beta fold hydrolase [Rhodospirillaceae bacterium]MBT3979682.1 alpha/beta fold hydrolase [Rhodospirillaceae bacterium]MBT4561939.1 alpha/beta fold hydrolase [Rhodospirillaceae bacterium]
MPELKTGTHNLHYEIIDLTAPWAEPVETILFHHGVGANWRCWLGWAAALQDRYRLVAFDLPGHGRSQPGDGGITIKAMVKDTLALADAVDCAKFHLVGESVGGTVALQTAILHPDRLLSLTVSNGAHVGGGIQNLDFWHDMIGGEGGMAAWSDRMMEHRFFPGALSADVADWYRAQQAGADPDTVLALLATLVGTNLSAQLSDMAVPTLLMHPDSSPFIDVPTMADLYARLPNAQMRIFPHAKHGLPFSHAEACSQTMRTFLDGLGGGA